MRPFRVLSLDGGGMRGTYTATYLSRVADAFARQRGVETLDIGSAFDLIVGTSTGGIIACALAAEVSLDKVVQLYRQCGPYIFERRLPSRIGIELVADFAGRAKALQRGERAMQTALEKVLGDETLAEVYSRRRIALAISAVELTQHRAWVFKTPHQKTSNRRDNGYRLVDVCLATSAAPIYRSLTAIDHPDGGDGFHVFADGGLWANNPVLIGLIEALELAASDQPIHVFSLGTCPRPAGEQLGRDKVYRGLGKWKFGGEAASLSIDAQEFAFDNMAQMLAKHLGRAGRDCKVIRFPRGPTPAALMPYLDLDDTSSEAGDALINQARTDADMTNSACGRRADPDSELICQLFETAPVSSASQTKG